MKHIFLPVNLHLFDGGAAAGGAEGGTSAPAADPGTQGETKAGSVNTQRGKETGEIKVRYGKQPATQAPEQAPAAGEATKQGAETPDTLEARQKEFDKLVNSDKFKDIYTKRTQEMINRRFSEAKTQEAENAKLREIASMLNQRYGVTDDADFSKLKAAIEGDDETWAAAAEEAGMTVEQYKKFDAIQKKADAYDEARRNDIRAQQQRQQAEKWFNEAKELQTKFPKFDLQAELNDPNFRASIQAGVPMELAYKGKYFDQFMSEATQATAAETEKKLVDNIRAKGQRPAENGTASQSAAFVTKSDPSKLTLEDFNEIARRVAHGEVISF